MPSKLKPVLLLGLAGGIVAALRKRAASSGESSEQPREGEDRDRTRRFAAPAEAGAQPPAEAGGAPSDDPQATVARSVPAEDLATKAHKLPGDAVMPDVSQDDPAVREAEDAAAADAAAIGRKADETQP
jgi:hypothetical protein